MEDFITLQKVGLYHHYGHDESVQGFEKGNEMAKSIM